MHSGMTIGGPRVSGGSPVLVAGGGKDAKNDRKDKVVVIKVGTSSLLRKGHLHLSLLGALAETCADLTRAGCKVIVVTSGAVGAGCQVLGSAVRLCVLLHFWFFLVFFFFRGISIPANGFSPHTHLSP